MSRKKQWDQSPEYLTAWESEKLLNLCEETVYRAIRRGELDVVRVGHSIRLPMSQFSGQENRIAEVEEHGRG